MADLIDGKVTPRRELAAKLAARQRRTEADGAIFEQEPQGSQADSAWSSRSAGQFTPKGKTAERYKDRVRFDDGACAGDPGNAVSSATVGNGHGSSAEAGNDAMRRGAREDAPALSVPHGVTVDAEEPSNRGAMLFDHSLNLDFTRECPRPSGEASAADADPDIGMDAAAEARDSIVTIDAGGVPEEAATAPASPAGSDEELPSRNASIVPELPVFPAATQARSHRSVGEDGEKASRPHAPESAVAPQSNQWAPSHAAQAAVVLENQAMAESWQGESASAPQQPIDDPLAMSSASYFQAYSRCRAEPENPPSKTPDPVKAYSGSLYGGSSASSGAKHPSLAKSLSPFDQAPFPKAKGTALRSKLREVAQDVVALSKTVEDAMSRPEMHFAELQPIINAAERIQGPTQLADSELAQIGWPTDHLRQMKLIVSSVEQWQLSEKNAKAAIEGKDVPLNAVIDALEQIFWAWCNLRSAAAGEVKVGLGLERRAKGVAPMVSALLDRAAALLRQSPEALQVRRLQKLLQQVGSVADLKVLGAEPLLAQSLYDVAESLHNLPQVSAAHGSFLANPEVLWRAIMEGDCATVDSIIRQGGLVSARTVDPQGHTVFWDAVAFQRVDIALLLLKRFPPTSPQGGVDLCEVHPRSGNALLHLLANLATVTEASLQLFRIVLDGTPPGFRAHRNVQGQTFVHISAFKMNLRMLQIAASLGCEHLFGDVDAGGWTPRLMLERHMADRHIAESCPAVAHVPAPMSRWCSLAVFQPPLPAALGTRAKAAPPPFFDAFVEVQDDVRKVAAQIHAHRIILASCSSRWKRELDELHSGTSSNGPTIVKVDAACCSSTEVAVFAVRGLYATPNFAECSFRGNPRLMLQLARFCKQYGLPPTLLRGSHGALIELIDGKPECSPADAALAGTPLAATLLNDAEALGVSAADKQHVARRLIRRDNSEWGKLDETSRAQVLEAALRELEPCFLQGATS